MPEMTSTQRQMLALCSLISAGDRCDWGGFSLDRPTASVLLMVWQPATFWRPARMPTGPDA